MLYRRLPGKTRMESRMKRKSYTNNRSRKTHIRHKSRRSYWCLHIRDFHEEWRNFRDIWFCRQGVDRWFLRTVFLDRRNHPRTSNWLLAGSHRTQKVGGGRNIGHECHLWKKASTVNNDNNVSGAIPQILMGASSSRRIGCVIKISRAFVQRYLISYSWSCTGLPGRFPRTVNEGWVSVFKWRTVTAIRKKCQRKRFTGTGG